MKYQSIIYNLLLFFIIISCDLTFNLPKRNNPNDSEANNYFGYKKAKIIVPENNGIITGFIPYFEWNAIDDAITYDLQVDNNVDFSSPEISISEYTNTNYICSSRTPFGQLYFRIRGTNKNNIKSMGILKHLN